jgi:hypothetical protein
MNWRHGAKAALVGAGPVSEGSPKTELCVWWVSPNLRDVAGCHGALGKNMTGRSIVGQPPPAVAHVDSRGRLSHIQIARRVESVNSFSRGALVPVVKSCGNAEIRCNSNGIIILYDVRILIDVGFAR